MKTRRQRFASRLALALTLASFSVFSAATPRAVSAQEQQYGALERGYRTGYSDGYQSGWGDSLKRAPYEFKSKADYQRADRAYINAYGAREDYRDGYQQGFEVGYEAGFNRGGFDSSVPPRLSRRGATPNDVAGNEGATRGGRSGDVAESSSDPNDSQSSSSSPGAQTTGGVSPVPSNTVLLVELTNRLSTDVSQRGDSFEARVLEPQEFEGATVAGRLTNVQRAGKAAGRAQLQLDFDQIRLPGSSNWEQFNAQVIEVVPVSGQESAEEVDPEGGVRGRSTTKEDAIKVGGAAGIGAIIGGIAGGGKGAGIGAIIGGAAGTGAVMSQRGKDIRFEPGQQLRIRTSGR
jgi:hypothetical protein